MPVTYENYEGDIITPALHTLLNTEFNTAGRAILETRFFDEFEPNYLAKRGEYIRWFPEDDTFISGISNGETRQYDYTLSYYIDDANKYIKKFYQDIITDRVERINKLLIENRTHELSGETKWHGLNIANRTKPTRLIDEIEEVSDSVWVVKMDLELTRTNLW